MFVEVVGGYFSYGDKQILKNINFKLGQGQVLSVLGPNGVGKTSLIKCICGLEKWDRGYSSLNGQDIKRMSKKDLWKELSYVPQSRKFLISYSGLEMVLMGLTVNFSAFSQPQAEDVDKSMDIMVKLGIEKLAKRTCNTMSGGELQMVLIARALVSQPSVILFDEPESGLDFKNQLIILDLIESLAQEEGLIVLINTHYPENALAISDKCLILKKDKTYIYGDTDEVLTAESIQSAFDVEVLINEKEYGNKTYKNIIAIGLLD